MLGASLADIAGNVLCDIRYPKSTPPGTGQAAMSQAIQLLHRLRPDQKHSAAAPALHAGCSSGRAVISLDLTGVSGLLLAWWGEYICAYVYVYMYVYVYIYVYAREKIP